MPSSVVATMRYDAGSATLRIVFVSGKVYDYKGVPPEEYEAMRSAGSKGKYLNEHIKKHYRYVKVKD
ncbi:MAG TPA: KTSC domain-containing protein [Chitinophaga sp.]|jgi:hypothetical protein|uniref:KTSC domain-containing protein n=1 Tax=Chitinophaga sp. TaxID=1869181 RepID=UPI002DB5FCF3|nr:KTSC domain-containing protein [Chitinophaga sp.]HEU4552160.1 KTSC domain-containing protein [Chitinophaga sp.]